MPNNNGGGPLKIVSSQSDEALKYLDGKALVLAGNK